MPQHHWGVGDKYSIAMVKALSSAVRLRWPFIMVRQISDGYKQSVLLCS